MNLFQGEELLSESYNKNVTLTTIRVRQVEKSWGSSHVKSIILEHVTSCERKYSSYYILLILGIAGVSGGIGSEQSGLVLLGLLCFIVYFFTVRNVIRISSPSAKIDINSRRMKKQVALDFINRVEKAINDRKL